MLIDWFTIVAQALNFLILVWLLKRFLYRPILNAIDEREQRIARELANAKAQKADAQKEHDEFKHKNEEFDRQRAALLTQAMDEVESERQRLLDMARKESEDLRIMLNKTIDNERESLNRNIMTRVQQEVFAIAKKTLADLAGVSLEKRITEVFIRRLREMSGEEKEKLTTVLRRSPNPILIRSAFDLPLPQQLAIHIVVKEIMATETKLQFETRNNLLSGIELVADGQKVAWNIMEYIESMEKSIDALISK
jgi:F-type H+-transporting ATPase subunit b